MGQQKTPQKKQPSEMNDVFAEKKLFSYEESFKKNNDTIPEKKKQKIIFRIRNMKTAFCYFQTLG